MTFAELPTVVRRTFDVYLARYAEDNPAAVFRQEGLPRREHEANVIPFVDLVSGAKYEVVISDAGVATVTISVG